MRTLADYTRIVSEIEQGRHPPGFDGKPAIDGLIVEICLTRWKKPDERSQAQSLALRLSRTKTQS
jgi:hypothetical protein